MDKIKNFFKDLGLCSKDIFEKAKQLFLNKKNVFFRLVTKAGFILLFIFGLILPLFTVRNSFNDVVLRFNGFDMPIGWLWILMFLFLLLVFLLYSINELNEKAAKTFRILTIIFIVYYIWLFINYIVAASDASIPTVNIGFGFMLTTFMFIGILILRWKESLILNPILKILVKNQPKEAHFVQEEAGNEE